MRRRLWQILIGGAVFTAAILIKPDIFWIRPALFFISYGIAGGDVVWYAVKNIIRGRVFDENFLMSIATIGAFTVGQYPEGVAVMLFYQVGELFQSYAVDKSRKSIAGLMDIRPDYANVKRGGELVRADPEEVKIGDIIVIKPGEKIPLDGKVLEGDSMADTSALTGESVPREISPGDEILSGCINLSGVITAEVTKEFGESTVSKILDLVENASSKKSNQEQFITRFARVYTPAVVIVAVLLAVMPPLIIRGAAFSDWFYRALTFLVVSCPCALVISIPLSFFGGIGGASRSGILVKGGNYLEALAKTEIVIFDKTGTLTKGVFEVQEIHAVGMADAELLELAACAESFSNHPISQSLKRARGREIDSSRVADTEELPGRGIKATVGGKRVAAGNAKMMAEMGIAYDHGEIPGTVVHTAVDGRYAGYIVIADELKPDAAKVIRELKAAGIKQTVMLTGDAANVGAKAAHDLGIDKAYSELLPAGKVEKLEELLAEKSAKGKLAFVGDGINDAPVLARADIGIAMGGLGSDAAIEAADIVIMTDEPSKISSAIRISKKTLTIANQNILFALGIKAAVLLLSAAGLANMWEAVFADVGVAVIAILNAFRALNVKKYDSNNNPDLCGIEKRIGIGGIVMGNYTMKSKKAYNKKAKNYDDTFDGKFTLEFKKLMLEHIRLSDDYTVLDVACGNGTLLKMLSTKNKIKAFGVDISEEMVKNAGLNCSDMMFYVAGCENLPFDSSTFDIITVCAAYHHFPDVKAFANEAVRVLKPGGYLYIAEVYLSTFLRVISNPFVRLSKDGDVKFYSAREIVNTFETHNFSCRKVCIKGHIQLICLQKSD